MKLEYPTLSGPFTNGDAKYSRFIGHLTTREQSVMTNVKRRPKFINLESKTLRANADLSTPAT
jgi:hypothetical protein